METLSSRYLLRRWVAVMSDATGRDIIYKFLASGDPGLPVVNKQMEIVGVVTEYDILGALKDGMSLDGIVAEKIMSKTPITADMDTPAKKLMEMMIENNLTIIPIVDKNRFLGIVNRHEILNAYVDVNFHKFFGE
ncbi:MAG: CBS domain-containing protein [Nitrospirota bacterium]|nr:CBS domain-containing protein [Nitrospirota bacterium]